MSTLSMLIGWFFFLCIEGPWNWLGSWRRPCIMKSIRYWVHGGTLEVPPLFLTPRSYPIAAVSVSRFPWYPWCPMRTSGQKGNIAGRRLQTGSGKIWTWTLPHSGIVLWRSTRILASARKNLKGTPIGLFPRRRFVLCCTKVQFISNNWGMTADLRAQAIAFWISVGDLHGGAVQTIPWGRFHPAWTKEEL